MRRLFPLIAVLIFPSIAFASWNAYIMSSTSKYRPWDSTPTTTSLTMNVVKGQWAAFQIATVISGEDVAGINIVATTPTKGGDTLNAPIIYREYTHNVYIPSRDDGATGEWPDPLVPKVDNYYGETRNSFPYDLNRVSQVYPVFDFSLTASNPVTRVNGATQKPTIGGTFSGAGQTTYYVKIDGAGVLGAATFKWSSSPIAIKAVKRVGNVVTVDTYSAHGLSVSDPIDIETSWTVFNGSFTVASTPTTTQFTYAQTGPDYYYNGGGRAIKTWNGTGVTTGSGVALNNGLTITFPSQNYVLGDEWVFYANTSRNAMIWIESFVPLTAPTGNYTSTITISATGKSDIVLNLTTKVYNVTIPKTSSIPVMWGCDKSNIGMGHFGTYYPTNGAAMDTLALRYTEAGLYHRISCLVSFIPGGAAPGWLTWNGSTIGNWTPYRDAIKPYMNGTWSWGAALTGHDVTMNGLGFLFHPILMTSTVRESDLTTSEKGFVAALATLLDAEGWMNKSYLLTAEEPSGTGFPTAAQTTAIKNAYNSIKAIDSRFKVYVHKRYVSDWVGYVDAWDSDHVNFATYPRSTYDAEIAAGKELWQYNGCDCNGCGIVGNSGYNIWPNVAIDAAGPSLRGQYWLMFDNDVRGDFYWGTNGAFRYSLTTWTPAPYSPWDSIYDFGSEGDGTFFYPGTVAEIGGTTPIPIESFRLKQVRAGLEDYEIFKLANIATAKAQIEGVTAIGTNKYFYTTPVDYSGMASQMETARDNILGSIGGSIEGGMQGGTAQGGQLN